MRNIIAFCLIILSFAFLIPGLYLPTLTIDIKPVLPFVGQVALYNETRSILGTVRDLYTNGHILISFLILLFSVIVPISKGVLLLIVLGLPRHPWRLHIYNTIRVIGKWSMADVFVVGIFLAFLSARAAQGIDAGIHIGFYLFLSYCLLSVLAVQFMHVVKSGTVQTPS